MAVHVAILLKRYVDLILDGRKTIESRLTKTTREPYQAIAPGERIHFKASSGPYMATAVADRMEFFTNLTPADIDRLQHEHNRGICGDDAYWDWKRDCRYATLVWLRDVQATGQGPSMEPSRGIAWFVLEDPSMQAELTGGAIRNRYVRAPEPMRSLRGAIELVLPNGKTVETDIRPDHLIRWRGWRTMFDQSGAKPGDAVIFEPMGKQRFRVTLTSGTDSPVPAPALGSYVSAARVSQIIRQARAEDLGPPQRDVTSQSLVPARARTTATFQSRQAGIVSGSALLPSIAAAYDAALKIQIQVADGQRVQPGDVIAQIGGSLRSILAMERVALNFLTHLSGIATLTAQYVRAVRGTNARIHDTRKTIPGLRGLAKYAVACGGGASHRIGLYDAVLVKDNHIAHVPASKLTATLGAAIARARAAKPPPRFVEVEVDTLEQLKRVLRCDVDIVLLDNMNPTTLRKAVKLRNDTAPDVRLEASGGVTLANVAKIAATGIERISVGAITHSAPALDIGLDIES